MDAHAKTPEKETCACGADVSHGKSSRYSHLCKECRADAEADDLLLQQMIEEDMKGWSRDDHVEYSRGSERGKVLKKKK
jgi:hypothetical protein